MQKRLRSSLTYANVIATLALFLALGGGAAYAASHLGRNSVGSGQLKRNSVTGAKVKDGSLAAQDFVAGALPSGPRGPEGERGPAGDRGAQGAPGATDVVVRYGEEGKPKEGEEGASYAACLPGEAVTGGGFDFLNGGPESFEYEVIADRASVAEPKDGDFEYTAPADGSAATGWVVEMNNETTDTLFFLAYAMCARP
jgi:hypothetical protein